MGHPLSSCHADTFLEGAAPPPSLAVFGFHTDIRVEARAGNEDGTEWERDDSDVTSYGRASS